MRSLRYLFALGAFLLASAPALAQPLEIADAKLGTGVENREITGETTTFAVNDKAFLWLRVVGGPADDIKVTWSVDDHSDTVSLKVGSASWRTWANKTLWMAGDWKVTVEDAGGQVLKEITFTVQ